MAKLIDGKAFAEGLRTRIATAVTKLKASTMASRPALPWCWWVKIPASKVYVANKAKQTVEVGMNSWEHKLPADNLGGRSSGAGRQAEQGSGGARHSGADAAAQAYRLAPRC